MSKLRHAMPFQTSMFGPSPDRYPCGAMVLALDCGKPREGQCTTVAAVHFSHVTCEACRAAVREAAEAKREAP